MATAKKTTTKSSSKSTTMKTTKKSTKLDLDSFTVSQTELASILGIATANITPMLQNGNLVKDENGRLNLRDSVSAYCKRMRERKDGKQSKSDIETETAKIKLDNLRLKNRDWRMTRDRQVATEILNRLSGAMMSFREQAKLNPALVDAIDELISNIGTVNADDISVIVEGDDEEDDD
jgi:phage terminase Nu1 subunit (DNA packaging protein)